MCPQDGGSIFNLLLKGTRTMSIDCGPTIECFSGFVALYDRHRPAPPEALADVLSLLAGQEKSARRFVVE